MLCRQLKKPRRQIPKFDANVLLEQSKGLDYLIEQAPKQRFGFEKGKELPALRRLMQFYRVWAFTMWPGMSFEEIIPRIEKLGKTGQIKAFMQRQRMELVDGKNATSLVHEDGESNIHNNLE